MSPFSFILSWGGGSLGGILSNDLTCLLFKPVNFIGSAHFLGSYAYIYTSNGVSLHELSISLSKDRKYSANDNDDLCVVCWDGGNLLLCDGCPRAFHKGQIYIIKYMMGKVIYLSVATIV